ncbi:MAG TPA: serine/threonine-protein kinase [Candidatus Krumholzibacteria bacterium]|nr:serine/threonine-protein kinase [Candidatus Krumholzibacteria bacterium]HRX51858.1 serine/threonine-protein kinase [Candidatus Krumholzibacteria bacterium]
MARGPANDDARYAEIQAVFLAALDFDEAERHDFILRRCGADTELLNGVMRLLAVLDADAADLAPMVDPTDFLRVLGIDADGAVDGYRLERLLGRGGMGVVYVAREVATDRRVVLKFLRPGLGSERMRERFAREIAVLARLRHPGICSYEGAGAIETILGTMPYLAMEYVDGRPLDRFVAEEAPDIATRVALMVEVCRALGHAHAQGVVHRDLKPANIIVDRAGRPRVLDFGVATVLRDNAATTVSGQTSSVVGTVDYMAPEQVHDGFGAPDPRTDIFALGVILYELICGARPFGHERGSAPRTLASILVDPTPSVQRLDGVADPRLEMIVSRCLAKRPRQRFVDGHELASELQESLTAASGSAASRLASTLRWRGLRALDALRIRIRPVLVTAMVLIVIASLVLLREVTARSDQRDEIITAVSRTMESVTDLIHVKPRTAATLRQALELLDAADARVAELRGKAPALAMNRYIHWRRGEALYFLGCGDDDRDLLWRAGVEFDAAASDPTPQSMEHLDPASDLFLKIEGVTADVVRAGYAGALEAIAEIHRSAYYLQGAYYQRASCLGKARFAPDRTAVLLADPEPEPGRYLDYGRIIVLRGIAAADTAAIAEGLSILAHVDRENLWAGRDWRAVSWFHEAYGLALRYLGELTGRSDRIRAAQDRLEKARQIRGETGGRTRYAATTTEMGLAEIALADLAEEPAARERHLAIAAARSRESLRLLTTEPGVVEHARAVQLLVDAAALAAVLHHDAAPLDSAAVLLDQVDAMIDPDRHPLPAARCLIARAALDYARALVAGDADPGAAAVEHEHRASALETAGQSPRLWGDWSRLRGTLLSWSQR